MTLQEAIILLRTELDITQEELSSKVGCSSSTIHRWETGRIFPGKKASASILNIAKSNNVSDQCYTYLKDVLSAPRKRRKNVLSDKYPKMDKDLLCLLTDSSDSGIYLVDYENYELIYVNRKGDELVKKNFMHTQDKRCFHYIFNKNSPCADCPFYHLNGNEAFETMVKGEQTGRTFHAMIKLINWNERPLSVHIVTEINTELEVIGVQILKKPCGNQKKNGANSSQEVALCRMKK